MMKSTLINGVPDEGRLTFGNSLVQTEHTKKQTSMGNRTGT